MGYINDESEYPVVLTTWSGETTMSDVASYRTWMFALIERAQRDGSRLALISDANGVTKTSPEVRRALSELGTSDWIVGTWVVSNSTLIRGVMAALRWVNPTLSTVKMVASLEQAKAEARAALPPR